MAQVIKAANNPEHNPDKINAFKLSPVSVLQGSTGDNRPKGLRSSTAVETGLVYCLASWLPPLCD